MTSFGEMIKMAKRILDEFSSLWKYSNKSLATSTRSKKSHFYQEVEDFLKFLKFFLRISESDLLPFDLS